MKDPSTKESDALAASPISNTPPSMRENGNAVGFAAFQNISAENPPQAHSSRPFLATRTSLSGSPFVLKTSVAPQLVGIVPLGAVHDCMMSVSGWFTKK